MIYFRDVAYPELVTKFNLLNKDNLIDVNNLSVESALYWKALVLFLKEEAGLAENTLEDMLPTLTAFCDYIKQ